MEYLYISWKQMQQTVESALEKLDHPVKGVIAVSRGGLIPAGFVTQQAVIKNIKIICLESYTYENIKAKVHTILPLPPAEELDGYLFVEDIVDSGQTIRYLRQKYPNNKYLALFTKPQGVDLLDYYGRLLTPEECEKWLVFPWYPEFLDSETYKNTP